MLMVLFPMWSSQLDARLSEVGFATDATLERGSVVRLDLTPEEQVWLWERSRRGVGHRRLASGGEVPEESGVNLPFFPDTLLQEWLASADTHKVVDYDFARERHINLQEAQALRTAIKRAARDPGMRRT